MPPTDKRLLLLDLDGTLADSLGVMKAVYRRFMESLGRESSDAEFEILNGPPIAEVVRILKAAHALAPSHADLLARYQELIEAAYIAVPPRAGAHDLLEAAKARGWIVGVVTSNSEGRTRAWLARVGLDGWIDVVVGGDVVRSARASPRAVARGKPAPDPYLAALECTGCKAENALAVEDSAQGATAATAAGIATLALASRPDPNDGWPAGVTFVAGLAGVRQRIEAGD